jgi:hypothetical protein
MSPVPASAFTIAGDEIIIDADLLAPKSARPRQAAHRELRHHPRDEYLGRTPGNHACKPHYCHIEETAISFHPTDFQGSVIDALRESIEQQIPNSRAAVNGSGPFRIEVTSPARLEPGFAGNGWPRAIEIQQTTGVPA